jgi:hypothetical protein
MWRCQSALFKITFKAIKAKRFVVSAPPIAWTNPGTELDGVAKSG